MENDEIRTFLEHADDVAAASLGRARMADGRRIELSVEDLARLVPGSIRGGPEAARHDG